MDAEWFIRACEALCGDNFTHRQICEHLKVNPRSLRRWIAGTAEIPTGVIDDLLGMLRVRAVLIESVSRHLDELVKSRV